MPDLAEEILSAAAFRSALRKFLARTEVVAANAGLSSQRYNLLLLVKAGELTGEQATVGRLRDLLELRQTAVSELARRAVEAGLVVREPSGGDGRSFLFRLTPEGERRLMSAFDALRDDRAELESAFSDLGREFRALTNRALADGGGDDFSEWMRS
jgi:DNA-binding MarR family transcriptional regulator